MTRWPRAARQLGLGLLAGAVFPAVSAAQDPPPAPPRPDTVVVPIPPRADAPPDTSAADTVVVRRDTLVTPFASAPHPESRAVGGGYVWDRDALFASGALTLLDLLEQVPGAFGMRTGWLVTPEQVVYGGGVGAVRVFLDGMEIEPLNPRTGGSFDPSRIELWTLEEVSIERAATQLRVHLRSWRVERTTPDSRVDIATGQLRTNIFRGYFGRRWHNGPGLQFGFQQYSTGEPNFGGDGDQISLTGRLGWAHGNWSLDVFAVRASRAQNEQRRYDEVRAPLPALHLATTSGYARAGYRQPLAEGAWLQLLAGGTAIRETTPFRAATAPFAADSADTTRTRPQYVARAGFNAGPLRLAGAARLLVVDGNRHLSPSGRAEFRSDRVSIGAFGERRMDDSTTRLDVELHLQPHPRVQLTGAAGFATFEEGVQAEDERAVRAEAGLRVGRAWLLGGAIRREGGRTLAPVVLDPELAAVDEGPVTGVFGGIRGPVYQDVSLEVIGTRWQSEAGIPFYLPQHHLRGQLTLDTRWLRRFPTGEFGFKAAGLVEYRSSVAYPIGETALLSVSSTALSALMEIRIQDAVLFIQSRNVLGQQFEQVPGFLMPRAALIYGVRWQFWN